MLASHHGCWGKCLRYRITNKHIHSVHVLGSLHENICLFFIIKRHIFDDCSLETCNGLLECASIYIHILSDWRAFVNITFISEFNFNFPPLLTIFVFNFFPSFAYFHLEHSNSKSILHECKCKLSMDIYIFCYHCRYSLKRNSIAATISKGALDISLWHQSNDLLQFGASLILDEYTSRTLGSLCYQYEMKDTIIKGLIDSDWTVGCTYTRWGD